VYNRPDVADTLVQGNRQITFLSIFPYPMYLEILVPVYLHPVWFETNLGDVFSIGKISARSIKGGPRFKEH